MQQQGGQTNQPQIKQTNNIPWYHARWFWGIIIILSALPGIYFYLLEAPLNLMDKIFGYFLLLPIGLDIILKGILKNILGKSLTIILYYTSFAIIFFLGFKVKAVKIKYPILLICILILSELGIIIARALST